MHHVSRHALNGRFKSVYAELVDRGVIVKSDRKKSKTVFAQQLGTKGHIIDLYLQDKRNITYEQAKKLCAAYRVSESFMFQGQGKPFNGQLPKQDRLAMALGIDFPPNILFTNVEAFSSNTVGVDLLEENDRFHIPGLLGDLVAFNINGNSMAPTIHTGDMVICNPIETVQEMKDNEIYAVVTNQSVWVKRVQKCFDSYGRWTHLKLISDNYHEFDPFLVEIKEVRKLLKVKRKLTGLD
ncbi:MAG: S24 family peptidase [Bacteroidota bacterium]